MTNIAEIEIDAEKAIELVGLAVAERGKEHRYNRDPGSNGCYYWDTDNDWPDCIVGLALSIAGWPGDAIRDLDSAGPVGVSAARLPDCITSEAIRVLEAAQGIQDAGLAWGTAYEAAEYTYKEIRGIHDPTGV